MTSDQSEVCHLPVMPVEVAELLVTDPDGAYLDLTAGGGGHLKSLAGRLGTRARLYGIDRDPEAVSRATRALAGTVQFRNVLRTAFGDLEEKAGQFGEESFSGILLDLGLSTNQLEEPSRGFSFRHDGPLVMRFDPSSGDPASELIASLDRKQLTRLIRDFGEEKQAARIAASIVRERQTEMISTTGQLARVVLQTVRPPHQNKTLARVFQAFRIAVNQELKQLARVLPASLELLGSGGRLAVISYHSLEDRLVKRFLQAEAKGRCTCPPDLAVCLCGSQPSMKIITRKPIKPAPGEIEQNPRARSARLRVGERL